LATDVGWFDGRTIFLRHPIEYRREGYIYAEKIFFYIYLVLRDLVQVLILGIFACGKFVCIGTISAYMSMLH